MDDEKALLEQRRFYAFSRYETDLESFIWTVLWQSCASHIRPLYHQWLTIRGFSFAYQWWITMSQNQVVYLLALFGIGSRKVRFHCIKFPESANPKKESQNLRTQLQDPELSALTDWWVFTRSILFSLFLSWLTHVTQEPDQFLDGMFKTCHQRHMLYLIKRYLEIKNKLKGVLTTLKTKLS